VSRVFWWYSTENLSPRVTPESLALAQELQMPGQFAMEHQNRWIERADSYTSQVDVDAAMGTGWVEQLWSCPEPGHVIAVDIGSIHDPTVVGAGHSREGLIYICRLVTLQGSREAPVRMSAIKDTVRALYANRQTGTTKIETWQGIGVAQDLQQELPGVELFVPTPKVHAEQWPLLAQRLSTRTLVLPAHPRLREELLGLSYEVGPTGVRVTDRSAVHQDHAVVVRMLVAALADSGSGLWWQRSHGMLLIGRGRPPAPAAAPFATSAPLSLEQLHHDGAVVMELARQKQEDVEKAAKAAELAAPEDKGPALATLRAAIAERGDADLAADIAEQKRLDAADARRLARWGGDHWRTGL